MFCFVLGNKTKAQQYFRSCVNTTYRYRADGTKIRKTHTRRDWILPNSLTAVITEYLDGFQYDTTYGSSLQFAPTSEGYFDFVKNKYIYNYADHLGNVRLSYFHNGSSIEVLEENNYYPFGLKHDGYNPLAGNTSYQYKFQGQELQENGWYSFKWRNYMPDVGRFFNIDPLSEKYTYQSHYNFSENKVVSHIELEGLEAIDANKIRKVFENGKKGQTYKIVIHVDQPGNGGDRDTYEIHKGSGPDPGHSFITLSRKNTDGTTDAKTFGFYPYPPSVNPLASEADGKVKDNYGHEKEVVQSWIINENKFNNVLDFVESKKNTKYDLNTNNCTDFVINAAGSAGINLPKTKGTWPNGGGSNPGDLGQDVRDQNARMRKGLPPNPAPITPNNKKEDDDKKISL